MQLSLYSIQVAILSAPLRYEIWSPVRQGQSKGPSDVLEVCRDLLDVSKPFEIALVRDV